MEPEKELDSKAVENIKKYRRGKVRVSCVFCDKRIAWMTPFQLKDYLSQYDFLVVCKSCRKRYNVDGVENNENTLTNY